MAEKKIIRCQIHCQKGKTINAEFPKDTGIYEKEGIYIEVIENTMDECRYGEIRLNMKNESCRENFNLRMEKPIRVYLPMEEYPEKITAMYLFNEWWTRPAFIEKFQEIPDYTQVAFFKYRDRFSCLLPMVGRKFKSYMVKGTDTEICLEMTSYLGGQKAVEEPLYFMAEAPTLTEAVHKVFSWLAEYKGIRMRENRRLPEMFQYLGWCSWDAFYTDVTEEKLRQKTKELVEKKVPVKWILIDDGWLSVQDELLCDFAPDKKKFPNGFKNMIGDIKSKGEIRWFGVWHAEEEAADTLEIVLEDLASKVEVHLMYGVLEENDIITRAVKIVNQGNKKIVLQKAASMNLDWINGEYEWTTFYGGHVKERTVQRSELDHGIHSIGSVRGTSSHHYNPFILVSDKNTDEEKGGCYGFSFLYSGEFQMEAEKDQVNQTRLICGIHPDNFVWNLQPGEAFDTPEVMMTYSAEGFGTISRNLHKTIRKNICRGEWKEKRRPVLINNWEATYFNFTGEKLVAIAKEAAALGVELFVLDDGWFGKRDDDNSGLGDWFPNEKKLGCTLKELAEKIVECGMQFGLWFEPECISEDSNLYREHPDWAVVIPERKPMLSRNQLILDFSRENVQDYIIDRMSTIFADTPITYVKWDFNRSICDKFSTALDAQSQGEFAHRYVLGLYRVLEALTTRFPHILFEGCSGGGGRFDTGMLYYTPQIWCSDNTDAIARLGIQYGTSFGYPVSTMGAHVSAVPNHQTLRITPFSTRGCVAMAGTFGYELDVTKLTDQEKEQVRKQISSFKEHYDLIQYGEYYRLLPPSDKQCTAWEMADPEGREAFVSVVYHHVESNAAPVIVKVQGLKAEANYQIHLNMDAIGALPDKGKELFMKYLPYGYKDGENLTGAALQQCGLVIPEATEEFQAWQIYIVEVL